MSDQQNYINEAIADGVFVEAVDAASEQVYIPTEDEINAYFLKAFKYIQDQNIPGTYRLTIEAEAHSSARELEIKYKVNIGEWNKEEKFTSGSLQSSAYNAVDRYLCQQACAVKQISVVF